MGVRVNGFRSGLHRTALVLGAAAAVGAGLLLATPRGHAAPRPGSVTAPMPPGAAKAGGDPLAAELERRLATDLQPLLGKYCYECHGNGKGKGGVRLDGPGDIASIMEAAEDWQTVVEVMNARLMPPPDKPRPTAHELLTIQQWVEEAVAYYPPNAKPDPGWYTIHRLNRSEYRNTIRDLLGIDPAEHDVAAGLPADDTGYGFDNIADVLSMSPLQLEKFLDAAEQAVAYAFGDAGGGRADQEVFFIKPTTDEQGRPLPGAAGLRRISEPQAARRVLERFATRAFRRHATAGDTAALMRVYEAARKRGEAYEPSVRLAITAALVSPNFLYRPIANPKPDNPQFTYTLDDYELASRLSYFLWSSMPDDRLLELARAKKLGDPAELRRQVRRMLKDPKADAMVENFAGQWLLLRKLDGLEMDPSRFPGFDAELRESMRREAELFFADVLREDRSVLSLLDSRRAFLNQALAEHYGVRGVRGGHFRAIELPADSPRGGVLTMAATLTVTSHATRTSPVKRGDYVLGQLMGSAPPPPPPDVPPLEQAIAKLGPDATLREQLAAHVEDPNCAVCHKRLDPIGLAMENFDAIGAWRDTEQGRPIDATGRLPGGVSFDGPDELKRVMLDRKDAFVEHLSKTVLTYAMGRGPEPFDRPTIQKIAQACRDDGYRMQALIEAVVLSDAFRKARGRKVAP